MPGIPMVVQLDSGRFGIRTSKGWFAYHYANADIADRVLGRILQDWNAMAEDVNFSYPEAFIASNYDGSPR